LWRVLPIYEQDTTVGLQKYARSPNWSAGRTWLLKARITIGDPVIAMNRK
jgi:hypothetical protein